MLGGTRVYSIADEPERPELTHQIATVAIETMPRLSNVPIIATWSGVRPMSPDGLPIIGWFSGIDGHFVATGHGGQGVMLGGGTGRLAAQMIRGEAPFTDPAPFSPSRFS
jgi:glycine/D-amino acid oxidase-like deaminating enzyme